MLPDVRAWLRGHPWQADGLLAAVLFAFSAGQWPEEQPPTVVAAAVAVSALLADTVVPQRRYG